MKWSFISIAASSLLGTTAFALNLELNNVWETGLYRAEENKSHDYRYKHIFARKDVGGTDVAIYRDQGFGPHDHFDADTTMIKLDVLIRPYVFRPSQPKNEGSNIGSYGRASASMRFDSKATTVVIGSRYDNGSYGLDNQDPILFVQDGHTLRIGDPRYSNQGITFNYSKVHNANDVIWRRKTIDTIAKLNIDGTFIGNISTKHRDGSASDSIIQSLDGRGSFLLYAKVNGQLTSVVRLDNATERISLNDYNGGFTNIVNQYAPQDSARINRFELNKGENDFGNPLVILSNPASSTFIDIGENYKGGSGFLIATEGEIDGIRRMTPTLFRSQSPDLVIGDLVLGRNGTIVGNLEKGGKIEKITFDNFTGFHYGNTSSEDGLVILQVKKQLDLVGPIVARDAYFSNVLSIVDTSDSAQDPTTFNFKTDLSRKYQTYLRVGENARINLSSDTFFFSKLSGDRPIGRNLTAASNVKFVVDDKRNRATNIIIGLSNRTLQGIEDKVIQGGLTFETNLFSSGKSDILLITNILNYESVNQRITLIPRTNSQTDYKTHKGKIVGYTPKQWGSVDLEEQVEWQPNDGILNNPFLITLASRDKSTHKEWYIKDYRLKSDPAEPEEQEPEKTPDGGGGNNSS